VSVSGAGEIRVDRLSAGDRAAWEPLFAAYNRFYERPKMDPARIDRTWTEFMADERLHVRGAWLDGTLAGIVHFLEHPSTTTATVCYLQDLFTAPAVRGRGVGRALIAAVADWARARGDHRVYWMTHETNATARALYDRVAEHHGFLRYDLDL
jgi:GNAT superfamily N-acetyltransferase